MKALVVNADWAPRSGYDPTPEELQQKRARVGSQVWKNPTFAVEERPTPEIRPLDLLIRVKRCGICGSDTHLYETDPEKYIIFSGPAKMPCVIGHEYSGIVEKIGSGVTTFQVGDRIAAESICWCGSCTPCRSGAPNQCNHIELAGITVDGALSELTRADSRHCWNINSLAERFGEEEAFDIGALIEPLGCAYNGMFVSAGGFKPGSTVVVYGVGPIGLGAVALARISGASKVIAFDPNPRRLAIAESMGADHAFNTGTLEKEGRSPADIVRELTFGEGAQMQVEAAGAAPYTIPQIERSLSVNGKIVYLGRAANDTPLQLNTLVSGANAIFGARGHSGYGIYDNLIKLISSGRLDVKEMITSYMDFDHVLDALKQSVSRCDGKIMVKVS
ncbi:MAG: alcohol dehydrogenase catalytic domain-containing protein [Magnetococcales bacterium]|nr:alcohol dehydrogenase catalytic domain-containing protein [Magnetococcales bacterium]